MKKQSQLPETVSSQQVETLSGLTARRLRQLADAAKIPQPKDGNWPTVATIKGLIAHYRTQRNTDALNAAKLEKLEAETRLLALTQAEREDKLIDRDGMMFVIERGLQAMVQCVLGMTELTADQRDAIINKLREAGKSAVEHKAANENS